MLKEQETFQWNETILKKLNPKTAQTFQRQHFNEL